MNKFIKLHLFIGVVAIFASCASITPLTPTQVHNTLPTLTKSKFMSQSEADEAIRTNGCMYLVRGRNYAAPLGLTVNADLKYGAKGIDEWVELDGGNAYVLVNYAWVSIDQYGTSQLKIEFDTMICE
jgi:hypothetical protein